MTEKLSRWSDDVDSLRLPSQRGSAAPGKSTLTSRHVMRKERDDNGVAANADVAVGQAAGSSGAPLPADLRERFEGSLGTDLSEVRIHTGEASAEANDAVGARAYATGQDIHFAAGQYDPASADGQFLIAHEVAHTVQQQGDAPSTQFKLDVSAPGDAHELEADHAAHAMVAGTPADVSSTTGMSRRAIQREYKMPNPLAVPPITIGMGLPPLKPLTEEDKVKIAESKTTFDSEMGYLRDLIGDMSLQQMNAANHLKTEVVKEDDLSLGGTILKMGVETAVSLAAGAIAGKLAGKLVGSLMEDAAIKGVIDSAISKGKDAAKTAAGALVATSLKQKPDSDTFFNALANSYPAHNDPARQSFDASRKAMWDRQKVSVESAERAAKSATAMHTQAAAAMTKDLIYQTTKNAAIDQWAVVLAQLKSGTAAGSKGTVGTDMGTAVDVPYANVKGVLYLTIKIKPGDMMVLGGATIHGIGDAALKSALQGRTVKDLNIPKQLTADFQGEWGPKNLFHEQSTYFRVGMNEKGVVWVGDTHLDGMDYLKKKGGGDAFAGVAKILNDHLGSWVPTFS